MKIKQILLADIPAMDLRQICAQQRDRQGVAIHACDRFFKFFLSSL